MLPAVSLSLVAFLARCTCGPARPRPLTDAADATRLTAAPSCTPRSGPGSEALAVPSRYVRPRHPLAPPPGILCAVRVRVREGRDGAWDGMKWLLGANTQSEPRGNRCLSLGNFFVSEDQDMEKIDRPLNFSHSFTI